jgi:arylsulfatase A-like enzyme
LKNERRGVDAKWQLYNLADDISETRDLAAGQPDKTKELTRQWETLNDQMIDPIWSPKR